MFMDDPLLFLSFFDLLHGGSLFQLMVAFMAQYCVFSWGPIWRLWGVLSVSFHVPPCVEDMKVFLRRAQHHFYTRPT